MYFFLVPFALCILIIVYQVGYAIPKRKRMQEERKENLYHYRHFSNAAVRGTSAARSSTAYKYLDEMELHYAHLAERGSPLSRQCYQEDMQELREYAKDLEKEEWEAKSSKILDEFYNNYLIVTETDFSDVDRIFRAKKRCIELWQKYFDLPEDHVALLYPKSFLMNYLGENYDPCMSSHDTLERKLDACIKEHRPEQRRKLKLYNLMIAYVEENVSVQRSKFLQHPFEGYSPDEIKCCYHDLVSRNRFAEIKMGNRYFVCLSDKELKKRGKTVE